MRNPDHVAPIHPDDRQRSAGRGATRRLPVAFGFLRVRLGLMVILGACAFGFGSRAAAPPFREYDLKAALLFNLTHFVEWPASAFPNADAPVVIGILGDDPFGTVLDEIVRHEKCGGRALKIERYRNVETARRCQILFVSASEEAEMPRIFRVLRASPIVTVGDTDSFDTRGGMIRFVGGTSGRVQLRINRDAFQEAGLGVSAKLLRLAQRSSATGN